VGTFDVKEERWVVLDAIPNYSVSSFGRVVNNSTGRELKATLKKDTGRYRVWLYRNGVKYAVYVHRLVARCFFVDYKDGIRVKHINGIYSDNSVLNLTLGVEGCRGPEYELGKG